MLCKACTFKANKTLVNYAFMPLESQLNAKHKANYKKHFFHKDFDAVYHMTRTVTKNIKKWDKVLIG